MQNKKNESDSNSESTQSEIRNEYWAEYKKKEEERKRSLGEAVSNCFDKIKKSIDNCSGEESSRLETNTSYELFDTFKREIEQTKYLKTVFTDDWFDELKELIDNYHGGEPFVTKTHSLFIAYCHELWLYKNNFVQELDRCYGAISDKIKTHRIKSLRDKLSRLASRDYPNYLGTVYEIIIVGKFTEEGLLKEYEPILPGTKYCPEALVDISGQEILIEATVRVSNEEIPSKQYRPGPGSLMAIEQLHQEKMKGKIDKLANIKAPFILFVNVELHIVFPIIGIPEVIRRVKAEHAFEFISAVITSYNYCRLDGGHIYINQLCKNPLNRNSIDKIKEIFKLGDETILNDK